MTELTIEDPENQAISPLSITQWTRNWRYETAGEEALNFPERYAILLVLVGGLHLIFNKHTRKEIAEKSLVVIDHKQLSHASWEAGTAVLEFIPPEKIFRFFKSCNHTFRVPCSTVVPMLPKLQQWADDLIAERFKPPEERNDECRRDYCMRLSDILKSYPPLLVGELLVAFQACAMCGEGKCRGGVCN